MRLISTREAARITGLSVNQLREWTIRRAIIPVDVKPGRQGSSAKYSWQTVLLLRIASVLKSKFHAELQAYSDMFKDIHKSLRGMAFKALRGKRLAISGTAEWSLVNQGAEPPGHDFILVHLDPHLEVLFCGFQDAQHEYSMKFYLFPVVGAAGSSASE